MFQCFVQINFSLQKVLKMYTLLLDRTGADEGVLVIVMMDGHVSQS